MLHRNRLINATTAAALLGLCAITAPATAQTTANASVSALAFVQGQAPLTAAGVNDLDFGTVPAGVASTPASLASDAGRFDLSGEAGAAITITYTLPTVLTGPGGSIPITFSATDGILWNPYPTGFTTFDPTVPLVTALDGAGVLVVGITGTVNPPALTTTGNYAGTITLTVSYL